MSSSKGRKKPATGSMDGMRVKGRKGEVFFIEMGKEWWEVDVKGEKVRSAPSKLVKEEDGEGGWWWVDRTYGSSVPEVKKEPSTGPVLSNAGRLQRQASIKADPVRYSTSTHPLPPPSSSSAAASSSSKRRASTFNGTSSTKKIKIEEQESADTKEKGKGKGRAKARGRESSRGSGARESGGVREQSEPLKVEIKSSPVSGGFALSFVKEESPNPLDSFHQDVSTLASSSSSARPLPPPPPTNNSPPTTFPGGSTSSTLQSDRGRFKIDFRSASSSTAKGKARPVSHISFSSVFGPTDTLASEASPPPPSAASTKVEKQASPSPPPAPSLPHPLALGSTTSQGAFDPPAPLETLPPLPPQDLPSSEFPTVPLPPSSQQPVASGSNYVEAPSPPSPRQVASPASSGLTSIASSDHEEEDDEDIKPSVAGGEPTLLHRTEVVQPVASGSEQGIAAASSSRSLKPRHPPPPFPGLVDAFEHVESQPQELGLVFGPEEQAIGSEFAQEGLVDAGPSSKVEPDAEDLREEDMQIDEEESEVEESEGGVAKEFEARVSQKEVTEDGRSKQSEPALVQDSREDQSSDAMEVDKNQPDNVEGRDVQLASGSTSLPSPPRVTASTPNLPTIEVAEAVDAGSSIVEPSVIKAPNPFSRDSSLSSSRSNEPSSSLAKIGAREEERLKNSQPSQEVNAEEPVQVERPKSRGANPFASTVSKLGISTSSPSLGVAPERPPNPRRASNPFSRSSIASTFASSLNNAQASSSLLAVALPPPLSPLRDQFGESSYASQRPTLVLPATPGGLPNPTTTVTEPASDQVEKAKQPSAQLKRSLSSVDAGTSDDLPSSNRPPIEAIKASGVTPSPFKRDADGLADRTSSSFPPQFASSSHSNEASPASLPLPPLSKPPNPSPNALHPQSPPTPTSSTSQSPNPAPLPNFKKKLGEGGGSADAKSSPESSLVASLESALPLESSSMKPPSGIPTVVGRATESSTPRPKNRSESDDKLKIKINEGKSTSGSASKGKGRESSSMSSQSKHARKGKKEREKGEREETQLKSRPRAVESEDEEDRPLKKSPPPEIILKVRGLFKDSSSTSAAQGSPEAEGQKLKKAERSPSTFTDATDFKPPRSSAPAKSSSSSTRTRSTHPRRIIESDSKSKEEKKKEGSPVASSSKKPKPEPKLEESKPSMAFPDSRTSTSDPKTTERGETRPSPPPSQGSSASRPAGEVKTEGSHVSGPSTSTSTTTPMPPSPTLDLEAKHDKTVDTKLSLPRPASPVASELSTRSRATEDSKSATIPIPAAPIAVKRERKKHPEEKTSSTLKGKEEETQKEVAPKKDLPSVSRTKSTATKSGASSPSSSTLKAKSTPKSSMDVASLVPGGSKSAAIASRKATSALEKKAREDQVKMDAARKAYLAEVDAETAHPLDIEAQANTMEHFEKWQQQNLPRDKWLYPHCEGGGWSAAEEFLSNMDADARGQILNEPIPYPTKGEDMGKNPLDYRWIASMETEWKNEGKVRSYLMDTKRFPDQERWGARLELEWDQKWGWGWGRKK